MSSFGDWVQALRRPSLITSPSMTSVQSARSSGGRKKRLPKEGVEDRDKSERDERENKATTNTGSPSSDQVLAAKKRLIRGNSTRSLQSVPTSNSTARPQQREGRKRTVPPLAVQKEEAADSSQPSSARQSYAEPTASSSRRSRSNDASPRSVSSTNSTASKQISKVRRQASERLMAGLHVVERVRHRKSSGKKGARFNEQDMQAAAGNGGHDDDVNGKEGAPRRTGLIRSSSQDPKRNKPTSKEQTRGRPKQRAGQLIRSTSQEHMTAHGGNSKKPFLAIRRPTGSTTGGVIATTSSGMEGANYDAARAASGKLMPKQDEEGDDGSPPPLPPGGDGDWSDDGDDDDLEGVTLIVPHSTPTASHGLSPRLPPWPPASRPAVSPSRAEQAMRQAEKVLLSRERSSSDASQQQSIGAKTITPGSPTVEVFRDDTGLSPRGQLLRPKDYSATQPHDVSSDRAHLKQRLLTALTHPAATSAPVSPRSPTDGNPRSPRSPANGSPRGKNGLVQLLGMIEKGKPRTSSPVHMDEHHDDINDKLPASRPVTELDASLDELAHTEQGDYPKDITLRRRGPLPTEQKSPVDAAGDAALRNRTWNPMSSKSRLGALLGSPNNDLMNRVVHPIPGSSSSGGGGGARNNPAAASVLPYVAEQEEEEELDELDDSQQLRYNVITSLMARQARKGGVTKASGMSFTVTKGTAGPRGGMPVQPPMVGHRPAVAPRPISPTSVSSGSSSASLSSPPPVPSVPPTQRPRLTVQTGPALPDFVPDALSTPEWNKMVAEEELHATLPMKHRRSLSADKGVRFVQEAEEKQQKRPKKRAWGYMHMPGEKRDALNMTDSFLSRKLAIAKAHTQQVDSLQSSAAPVHSGSHDSSEHTHNHPILPPGGAAQAQQPNDDKLVQTDRRIDFLMKRSERLTSQIDTLEKIRRNAGDAATLETLKKQLEQTSKLTTYLRLRRRVLQNDMQAKANQPEGPLSPQTCPACVVRGLLSHDDGFFWHKQQASPREEAKQNTL